MRARRCPSCGSKVGRENLMCPSCSLPVAGDLQPIAIQPVIAPSSERVDLDVPIPGTRQWGKLLMLTGFAAIFFWVADPILRVATVAIFIPLVSSDVFSVFGWEHVVLSEGELSVERRLFGRVVKSVRFGTGEIESIRVTPKPIGLKRLSDPDDRDQNLWTFSDGPIVVETADWICSFGQGLINDRDIANELVARLKRELSSEGDKQGDRLAPHRFRGGRS